MPNQHKPLPELEDIACHILVYWKMGYNDIKIKDLLLERHIDKTRYGLSVYSLRKMRVQLGLLRPRNQPGLSVEDLHPKISELRKFYPKSGGKDMKSLLLHEKGMSVSRNLISAYFHTYEPDLVRERKLGRLRRRRFWAAGVNDIVAVDQHDKWKYLGLALHTGIDPFAGKIHWMKVWYTNSNPKLIASYYLDFIAENNAMPLVSQSDPGSENYGIANVQTVLRQTHDPSLTGTLQHRWMRAKKNVMPEIAWSQLRRRFTPGFESYLQNGIVCGWYDPSLLLDKLLFRWLFIPWLQTELDQYVTRVNNTKKRADRNKILPHGVPNDIYNSPGDYGCLDFKVSVDPAAIEHVRNLYAPQNDPVFTLVPGPFAEVASALLADIGNPVITRDNAWDIYQALYGRFETLEKPAAYLASSSFSDLCELDDSQAEEYALVNHVQELAGGEPDSEGFYYMGGVNNGNGLDATHHEALNSIALEANFSDDESLGDELEAGWHDSD